MNGGTTHSFQTPPQVYPAFDGHGSTNETKLGLFYGMNCTYPSPDAQNLSFCTSEPQGVTGCTDALPEWALLRLAAMQVLTSLLCKEHLAGMHAHAHCTHYPVVWLALLRRWLRSPFPSCFLFGTPTIRALTARARTGFASPQRAPRRPRPTEASP